MYIEVNELNNFNVDRLYLLLLQSVHCCDDEVLACDGLDHYPHCYLRLVFLDLNIKKN